MTGAIEFDPQVGADLAWYFACGPAPTDARPRRRWGRIHQALDDRGYALRRYLIGPSACDDPPWGYVDANMLRAEYDMFRVRFARRGRPTASRHVVFSYAELRRAMPDTRSRMIGDRWPYQPRLAKIPVAPYLEIRQTIRAAKCAITPSTWGDLRVDVSAIPYIADLLDIDRGASIDTITAVIRERVVAAERAALAADIAARETARKARQYRAWGREGAAAAAELFGENLLDPSRDDDRVHTVWVSCSDVKFRGKEICLGRAHTTASELAEKCGLGVSRMRILLDCTYDGDPGCIPLDWLKSDRSSKFRRSVEKTIDRHLPKRSNAA